MTVYVTAISPGSARQHEHITGIRWLNSDDSTSNTMSVSAAVGWLKESAGNRMYVAGETGAAEVKVVNANPPYLRTVADNSYTDNLLYLPRY